MTEFPKNDATAIMLASVKDSEIEQWLNDWIRKRYKHGNHVPSPPYLLTEVFLEALKDYERERSNDKQT